MIGLKQIGLMKMDGEVYGNSTMDAFTTGVLSSDQNTFTTANNGSPVGYQNVRTFTRQ